MADQLIKISDLPTLTGSGTQGIDIIPIVDTSVDVTKSISLTQLVSYLQGQGLGASVTNVDNTTVISGGTAGAYYEKRYQRTNAAPSAPPDSPYPPSVWTVAPPGGNQLLWSTTALINAAGNALETGSSWSSPTRESAGPAVLFRSGASGQPADSWLIDGDVWYDINDNNKIYRRSSGAWVAAFTPFPNVDVNNRFAGFVTSTGGTSNFAIVATNFQVINPATAVTDANVPFEIDGATGAVFIKSAYVKDLNAGVLTAGEITAAISLQSNRITAASMSNGSTFFNNDGYGGGYTTQRFPAVCFARSEVIVPAEDPGFGPLPGPNNDQGDINWLSDAVSFYGWARNDIPTAGGGYSPIRFGKPNMIFTYSFEGYGLPIYPFTNQNINLNVMYQIDNQDPVQVQFPQADSMNNNTARLSQHGSIYLQGLTGLQKVRFGYRAASAGNGEIRYSQLTVLGYNI